MVNLKTFGWSVTVVGAIQLLLTFMEGGGLVEYILAILVLVLGLWAALGK